MRNENERGRVTEDKIDTTLKFFKAGVLIGSITSGIRMITSIFFLLDLLAIGGTILTFIIHIIATIAFILCTGIIFYSGQKKAEFIPKRSQNKMKVFSSIFLIQGAFDIIYLLIVFLLPNIGTVPDNRIIYATVTSNIVLICYGIGVLLISQVFSVEKELFQNKTRRLYSLYGVIASLVCGLAIIIIIGTIIGRPIIGNASNSIHQYLVYTLVFLEMYLQLRYITKDMLVPSKIEKINEQLQEEEEAMD